MNDHGWWHDAKCKGQPVEDFDIDRLPNSVKRTAAAQALCVGCPALRDCANDALANWDYTVGIVVAGVAVSGNLRHRARYRKRLEAVVNNQVCAPATQAA